MERGPEGRWILCKSYTPGRGIRLLTREMPYQWARSALAKVRRARVKDLLAEDPSKPEFLRLAREDLFQK